MNRYFLTRQAHCDLEAAEEFLTSDNNGEIIQAAYFHPSPAFLPGKR